MFISNRAHLIPESPIRKLVPLANAAKANGCQVIHLNIGDPDIKTLPAMIDELKNLNLDPIGYSPSQGEPSLITSLVNYYHQLGYFNITNNHIQITSGGSEAISFSLAAICDPGEEVIVFDPTYPNYLSLAISASVNLVGVASEPSTGYHLPPIELIASKLTSKTKAILLCNPSNPTGVVYSEAEISSLVDFVKEHNLWLLSDEVYREFVYDHNHTTSLLSFVSHYQKLVVIDSLSKRFSVCGLRIGNIVTTNTEFLQAVLRMAMARLSVGKVDQLIAAKLSQVTAEYQLSITQEYQQRRNLIFNGLTSIPHVSLIKPEGAFYAMPNLPIDNSDVFCRYLLTDFANKYHETVMLAPGAGFYLNTNLGKNSVRIAYVVSQQKLQRAIDILKTAIQEFSS